MAETLFSKVKRAWNAFSDSDWDRYVPAGQMISSSRPDRVILSRGNEKNDRNRDLQSYCDGRCCIGLPPCSIG